MGWNAIRRNGCPQSFHTQGCKRKLEHFQAVPALPTAFALSPSALSPGLSPAYVAKCAPIRSTSVDSETSSSTPYAAAKRQCLDALHPSTPTGLCSRWQQQPEPQSTHKMLGNGTLTCSGSYQCMPQQPQRHSSFLDGATEMPPQPLFGQAAPTRASDINCRQQWTELHCSLSQHQLQHHHQQQSLTQQQMQTQTSQHQRDCCNRQTSSAVQQTANSELIHFVQQVFDTHTPPQRQEQLQSCRARQPRHQLPCLAGGRAILSSSAGHMQPAAVLHLQQQQTQSTQSQSRATLPQDHLRYLWQVHQHMQAQRQLALLKQNAAVQQSLLVRQHDVSVHQPTFPRIPSLGFADLMMYWAKGLALQRPESLHLACHLWNRVQSQISIAYMQMLGAERPWETMLAGCLWLAAKLEENRRGVPTASKMGLLLSIQKTVVGEVELYLMQLVNWAPLHGWQALHA